MMESYDETRHLDNRKAMQVKEILGLKMQNDLSVLNCVELNDNKQNMDFGAEIVDAEMLANEHEIKTNLAKITHTVEEQADTLEEISTTTLNELLSDLEEQGHDIHRGHNNDDADSIPQFFKGFVKLPTPKDDEDDGDDYQSDENENELNENQLENSDDNNGTSREDDSGEDTSTDSDFSDLSGLSDISGRDWKPIQAHPLNWVQKQINSGANPRQLLSQMLPSSSRSIAPGLNDMTLWRILASMLSEPPRRQKLRYINTLEDVLNLIQQSKNIMVLTGAGVSVSCGIPDFRSSDGIYARLAKDYPDLPDPQAMFDINYFSRDPRPFFKFAREIYPGQFKPSPCHRFIKLLEEKKKLLRNYTQNIDTLEQVAGIQNVIECHGSFSTASCTKCKYKCGADAIRADIFAQCIPVCPRCQPNVQQSVDASEPVSEDELKQLVQNGIMKPDIVFFGEGLPELFHTVMASDKDKCDLLIVVGSSLKVRPVALIPSSIPAHVPQILINREQLHHLEFDVELLGDSDVIINQLCHRLGENWRQICFDDVMLQESDDLLPLEEFLSVDSDDYGQQLQDVDTQSVQSSTSTDIGLRSAGVSSDSGCDTSSSAVIKTDSVESPLDSIDFSNPDFHPFVERLGNETSTTYTLNSRHMSVDSSKDSGIQCETSNPAAPSGSCSISAPVAPITNFDVRADTILISPNNDVASSSASRSALASASTSYTKSTNSNDCTLKPRRRRPKRVSVAERLLEGTYYRHNNSYSYVFPGALVSLCTDSDDEDDDSEDDVCDDNVDDEKSRSDEVDVTPLSPLLPPSVEAEMVSEITTVATARCNKRLSSDNSEVDGSCTIDNQQSSTHNMVGLCNPSPMKRRRESAENLSPGHNTIEIAANTVATIAAKLESDAIETTGTTCSVSDACINIGEQTPTTTLVDY